MRCEASGLTIRPVPLLWIVATEAPPCLWASSATRSSPALFIVLIAPAESATPTCVCVGGEMGQGRGERGEGGGGVIK